MVTNGPIRAQKKLVEGCLSPGKALFITNGLAEYGPVNLLVLHPGWNSITSQGNGLNH